MGKYRSIDIADLRKSFRIVNGRLEKYYKRVDMWKVAPCNITKAGYRYTTYNGKPWRYCRLLYVLYTGQDILKGLQIDHINGVRHDDRIENLRVVTPRENNQNKKIHCSELVGVRRKDNKYIARININYHPVHLGLFATQDKAQEAYQYACEHTGDYINDKQFRAFVKDGVGVKYKELPIGVYLRKNDNTYIANITCNKYTYTIVRTKFKYKAILMRQLAEDHKETLNMFTKYSQVTPYMRAIYKEYCIKTNTCRKTGEKYS